jgi:hypothetical protein
MSRRSFQVRVVKDYLTVEFQAQEATGGALREKGKVNASKRNRPSAGILEAYQVELYGPFRFGAALLTS